MSLEIRCDETTTHVTYSLIGRLDTNTAPDFEAQVGAQLGAGRTGFLVDLSQVDYISSAGLRVFLMLGKKLGRGKGTMVLCGMSEHVREVFDIAGFSKIFTIEPDQAAAQSHFA